MKWRSDTIDPAGASCCTPNQEIGCHVSFYYDYTSYFEPNEIHGNLTNVNGDVGCHYINGAHLEVLNYDKGSWETTSTSFTFNNSYISSADEMYFKCYRDGVEQIFQDLCIDPDWLKFQNISGFQGPGNTSKYNVTIDDFDANANWEWVWNKTNEIDCTAASCESIARVKKITWNDEWVGQGWRNITGWFVNESATEAAFDYISYTPSGGQIDTPNIIVNISTLDDQSNHTLWDNTMETATPVTKIGGLQYLDNGNWNRTINISADESGGQTFTNITFFAIINDTVVDISGSEYLNITSGGNEYDLENEANPQDDCNSSNPTYNQFSVGDKTYWLCKKDTNSDGIYDYIKVKQSHWSSTIYQSGGKQNTGPPTITNTKHTPQNPAYGKDDVNANATVTDDAEVDTVLFEANFTGTFQNYSTSSISSEYYYIIPQSELSPNEEVQYRFIANDTFGKWNDTEPYNNFTVTDQNPPNITDVSYTPDPVRENNDATLSATVKDDVQLDTVLLEANFTGIFENYATSKSGDVYSFTISSGELAKDEIVFFRFIANDTSGNWNNTDPYTNFTVLEEQKQQQRGGGGGGGGFSTGGGGMTGCYQWKYIQKISKGLRGTALFTKSCLDIEKVYITAANDVENIKITIESVDKKPGTIEYDPEGIPYKYLLFKIENVQPEDIENAEIYFRISKTWVENQSIDEEKVSMSRYTEAWNKLQTTKRYENKENITYSSETPGFSTFVITGLGKAIEGEPDSSPQIEELLPTVDESEAPEIDTPETLPEETQTGFSILALLGDLKLSPASLSLLTIIILISVGVRYAMFRNGGAAKEKVSKPALTIKDLKQKVGRPIGYIPEKIKDHQTKRRNGKIQKEVLDLKQQEEEIVNQKKVTAQNYLSRRLDEDIYKHMMADLEGKLINIRTKMQNLKKQEKNS